MNPFADFVILCRKNNNHLFTFSIFQRISEKQKIKRRFISLLRRNVIKLWRLCSSEVLNVNVQRFCFLNPGLLHIQDTHGKTIKIWLVQYTVNVYEMPRVPLLYTKVTVALLSGLIHTPRVQRPLPLILWLHPSSYALFDLKGFQCYIIGSLLWPWLGVTDG